MFALLVFKLATLEIQSCSTCTCTFAAFDQKKLLDRRGLFRANVFKCPARCTLKCIFMQSVCRLCRVFLNVCCLEFSIHVSTVDCES